MRQLGDILLTTPALTSLKKQYLGSEVHFLCHKMGHSILDENPYVDRVLSLSDQSSWLDYLKMYKTLRAEKYDHVFDFMNNPRSALLAFFSKGKNVVSFESKRRLFYSHVVPRGSDQRYIVDQKLDLIRTLDFKPQIEPLVFPWSQDDLQPLRDMISQRDDFALSKVRVLMSPTHRRVHRQWPKNHYAVLSDYLYKNWNATITWLWGPGEEEFIDDIQARCKEPSIKAPRTTMKEMAALIANHDVFVGNSNGPSHFAVAQDICSLQLHGHTIAASWCPNNRRHRSIQSPMNRENPEVCMPFITVPVVVEKLESMRKEIEAVSESRRSKGLISTWAEISQY